MSTQAMSTAIYDEYQTYVAQYKKEYGDNVVVLMQVGSFYEVYSADDLLDIKYISEVLNITLTRKNKNISEISKSNCNMIGFPLSALTKYVSILVQNNFTIVIVSQVTPPPQPKREVTDIVSPGTKVDDLSAEENSFLMTVFIEESTDWRTHKASFNLGVSYIDVSTGVSNVFESSSKPNDVYFGFDEAYRIILATTPREIAVLGELKTIDFDFVCKYLDISKRYVHNKINNFDKEITNVYYQNQILTKLFPSSQGLLSPIEMLNLEKSPFALASFISLIHFTSKHSEYLLEKLNKPIIIEDQKHVIISYNTAQQLNIIQNSFCQASLVDILNNCKTAIGKRRFKDFLLNPSFDPNVLNNAYNTIEFLLQSKKWETIRKQLESVSDIERQTRKIMLGKLHPFEIISLRQSLKIIDSIQEHGFELKGQGTSDIITSLEYIDEEKASKQSIDSLTANIFVHGKFPDLDSLQDNIDNNIKRLTFLVETLNTYCPDTFFKLEHNEKDGFYITITIKRFETFKTKNPSLRKINVLGQCFTLSAMEPKKASSSSSIFKIDHPMVRDINDAIQQYTEEMKSNLSNHYKTFLADLSKFKDDLTNVVEFIGDVDYKTTNAYNAIKFAYCRPSISDINNGKSYIQAKSIRHPIIERINDKFEYVPNDVSLGIDNQNGMLLYGINAAGKSSLMKSIGLCTIMASAGMFVPCSSFQFFPYNHIYTRIPTGDNMYKGQSTFTNEISELRNILQRADSSSLVIGDELCSGTESISAMSIISAGIIELCNRGVNFIFATHLHDLVNISAIQKLDTLRVFHLNVEFDEKSNKLIYDRKLQPGQGKTLYGLEVCKSLDLPRNFISLANEIRQGILGNEQKVVSDKRASYNKKMFYDVCQICKKKGQIDMHHIKEQQFADENGYIGHIHKNHYANLVGLCQQCHDEVHKGNIVVNGYHQTSNGRELSTEYITI